MIQFTTRNRPHVLEYSLNKTREVYDGFIVVIDDNSDTKEANESICKKYDAEWLYNDIRLGIPRSKDRGFRRLLSFDYQYWFDDDCYPKTGWLERVKEAQEFQPHLLYLRDWAHIRRLHTTPQGLVQYSGATACFMSFTKAIYRYVKGFESGHGIYGGWHHTLSCKLAPHGIGEYVSIERAEDYFHSFDIDQVPKDFDGMFQSSLPKHERVKK